MSLTRQAARELMYQRFRDEWGVTTEYRFEGEYLDPDAEDLTEWARFTVRHSVRTQETMGCSGTRLFRSIGRILIQVFTIMDGGLDDAQVRRSDELCGIAATAFESLSFGGIDTYAATTTEGNLDGRWWQQLVDVPFAYYEVK